MFGRFQKTNVPWIDAIQLDHSEDCATVHAASFTYAWPQADFETLLSQRSTFAEGAYGKDKELVGFIFSRLAADEAEILTIAVLPKRRGQHIAHSLMKENMRRLQAAGARSWFLEVEAQNRPALALYESFGFRQVGERTAYYRSPGGSAATALILRRDLR